MTFEPVQVESFQELFNATKHLIRHFDGCERLELLRDVKETNVFFTYSWWQSEEHLNKYRFSPLFKEVWSKTKVKFCDKPQAWSLTSEVVA